MKMNRDSLLSYLNSRNIPYSEGKMGIHYAVRLSHGSHSIAMSFWPNGDIHDISIDGWLFDGWGTSIGEDEDVLYTHFIKIGDFKGKYLKIINMKFFMKRKEKIA